MADHVGGIDCPPGSGCPVCEPGAKSEGKIRAYFKQKRLKRANKALLRAERKRGLTRGRRRGDGDALEVAWGITALIGSVIEGIFSFFQGLYNFIIFFIVLPFKLISLFFD